MLYIIFYCWIVVLEFHTLESYPFKSSLCNVFLIQWFPWSSVFSRWHNGHVWLQIFLDFTVCKFLILMIWVFLLQRSQKISSHANSHFHWFRQNCVDQWSNNDSWVTHVRIVWSVCDEPSRIKNVQFRKSFHFKVLIRGSLNW